MYYLHFAAITNRLTPHYTGTTIKHLTGAALAKVRFPIPPLSEQRRIVAKIEELFSDLDAGVVALERVRANLKQYRAAVLKAAVQGKLTEEWRAQHPDTEPASMLLERILTERRRQWEKDQLAKFAQAGKQPPKGWQSKYAPPEDAAHSLPDLPGHWCWVTIDAIAFVTKLAGFEYTKFVKYEDSGDLVSLLTKLAINSRCSYADGWPWTVWEVASCVGGDQRN